MKIAIVGGGWAGLAAAVELDKHHIPFTLYEASDSLGGRTRRLHNTPWPVDCGHHVMLGAYHRVQALINELGNRKEQRLSRHLLRLDIRGKQQQRVTIQIANVSAPMHLFWGLLRAQGLGLHERGTVLRLTARLARKKFELTRDKALADWLRQEGQTKHLIDYLWRPLCLAAMNTPIEHASSRVFVRILKECFAYQREDSDLLLFSDGISQTLPRLVEEKFRPRQQLQFNSSLQALNIEQQRIKSLTINDQTAVVDHVILATPAHISQQLLAPQHQTQEVSQQISQIEHQTICTIYLQYPENVRLNTPMIGLVGGLCQWIYDKSSAEQPGHIAVVIRGPGEHLAMDDKRLLNEVTRELSEHFPHWPAPLAWHIVREPRATFSCHLGHNQYRPTNKTPLDNLWLAGDYTDTGYPACLEGAVLSGIRSAQALIENIAADKTQSAASA